MILFFWCYTKNPRFDGFDGQGRCNRLWNSLRIWHVFFLYNNIISLLDETLLANLQWFIKIYICVLFYWNICVAIKECFGFEYSFFKRRYYQSHSDYDKMFETRALLRRILFFNFLCLVIINTNHLFCIDKKWSFDAVRNLLYNYNEVVGRTFWKLKWFLMTFI